jgi:hypothetical protein
MKQFKIDMAKPYPSYLLNWSKEHTIPYMTWADAIGLFHETTGGHMEGISGETKFDLVFYDDAKATWFILRYS